MAPIITLLTDFGLADTYVGQMKGAILAINPDAVIVDLTHEVRPQQVRQGAFLLETAVAAFPPVTIHVAVVDPGVGSDRAAIAIRTAGAIFVGPDNGVLSAAVPAAHRPAGDAPARVALPDAIEAVRLENARLRGPRVSNTFHGRDIFAPAAAHLSLGLPLAEFGPATAQVIALPPFRAQRQGDRLVARVISIDRFGNVITDCRGEDLPRGRFVVHHQVRRNIGAVRTYAEAHGLAALVGSAGFLELAEPGGSAAALLNAVMGDVVVVEPLRSP